MSSASNKDDATAATTTLSFVKRAVLASADGGNTYNVEVEQLAKDEAQETAPRVSLYEQLSKTISERRAQRVEGRPEELSLEDQEFVDRVEEQKRRQQERLEAEAKEFKKQRLAVAVSQSTGAKHRHSGDAPEAALFPPSLAGTKNEDGKGGEDDDDGEPVIVVKKKKKRAAPS